MIGKLNKKYLSNNYHEYVPSRGKGKYKGKIVKRQNPYESVKSKAKKGARLLSQQYADFDEDELRKMLMESMSIGKKKTKPSYSVNKQLLVSESDDSSAEQESNDSDF
jgi:hypothetical protein